MTFQQQTAYGVAQITMNPQVNDLRTIDVKVTYKHPKHLQCTCVKHAGKQRDFVTEDSENKTTCTFNVSLRDYNTATGIIEDAVTLIEPIFEGIKEP